MCDGDVIGPEHLPEEVLDPARDDDEDGPAYDSQGAFARPLHGAAEVDLDEIQRQAMVRAVRSHRGSRRDLARKLGISERTLYRRLRELGLLGARGG